jgi:hypothetical protein
MQDIYYQKKIYVIPENWNELTAKQLVEIVDIIHNNNSKPEVKELMILKCLLNCSWFKFLRYSSDLKTRLIKHIQWIADDKLRLTEPIISSYRNNIFCKKLYSPDKEFNNLKMIEFHYAEVAYRFLVETKNDKYLDELVAILYRSGKENYDYKRNPDGDIRIDFKGTDVDYHKKIVAKWPRAVKQSILMWYNGCREMLVEDYPLVYGGTPSTENYYAGLYTMMRSVAGEKFGTIAQVEQLYVNTAHLELTCSIEEAKELEEEHKNNK